MLTLRGASGRHLHRRHKREIWQTFPPPDLADPLASGFGCLERLSEGRLPPGASVARRAQHDVEVVTYVREGALGYAEPMGSSGVIHAGEFQRMSVRRGARHVHTNLLQVGGVHMFQLWLCPSETELESSHEQKRFSVAQRRGEMCMVASPDARRGTLLIQQDALLYSALFDAGQHVVHELTPGRSAWLHVVQGEAALGDLDLAAGDGVGVRGARSVSFTAKGELEILLLDQCEPDGREIRDQSLVEPPD